MSRDNLYTYSRWFSIYQQFQFLFCVAFYIKYRNMSIKNNFEIIGFDPYLDNYDSYSLYSTDSVNSVIIDKDNLISSCDDQTMMTEYNHDNNSFHSTFVNEDSNDSSKKIICGKKVLLADAENPWFGELQSIMEIDDLNARNENTKEINEEIKQIYKENNDNLTIKNSIYSYISNFYSSNYINLIVIFILVFLFIYIKF